VSPFLQRIGPGLAQAYVDASALGNAQRPADALAAYDALLLAPEARALPPGDAAELWLVLQLGRAKCLAALGRQHEAWQLLQWMSGREAAAGDFMTRWDFANTAALTALMVGELDALPEATARAVTCLGPAFLNGGGNAATALELATMLVMQLAAGLRRRDAWGPLLGVVIAAQEAAADYPGADLLGLTCTVNKLEALVAADLGNDARDLAQALSAAAPPQVLDLLVRLASEYGLTRAVAVLRPRGRADLS
jgi:hypothetical protein